MARVQVVDDDQAICWCLRRLGDLMGHEVRASASAEEALQVARQFRPHLVILDIRLPGMDGLAALREYRAQMPSTRVLVITAFTSPETAAEVRRKGGHSLLPKPFTLAEAREAIGDALVVRCEQERPHAV